MFWSKQVRELLLQLYSSDEGVTRNEQDIYDTPTGYYIAISKLQGFGLIEHKGRNEDNMKVWELTDTGEEVAKAAKTLKKHLTGD